MRKRGGLGVGIIILFACAIALISNLRARADINVIAPDGGSFIQNIPAFSLDQSPHFLLNSGGSVIASSEKTVEGTLQTNSGTVSASLVDSTGHFLSLKPTISPQPDSPQTFLATLQPPSTLKPGIYTLKTTFAQSGNEKTVQQNFFWGLVSLTANTSLISPAPSTDISFDVFQANGQIDCDADMDITATLPNGATERFSTKNDSIHKTNTCSDKTASSRADYTVSVKTALKGKYILAFAIKEGDRSALATQQFTVAANPDYVVEQSTGNWTHVHPNASLRQTMFVHVSKSFDGVIKQTVPADWTIQSITDGGKVVQRTNTSQTIAWPAQLKPGGGVALAYSYKIPDTNHTAYALQPVEFWQPTLDSASGVVKDTKTYTEPAGEMVFVDSPDTPFKIHVIEAESPKHVFALQAPAADFTVSDTPVFTVSRPAKQSAQRYGAAFATAAAPVDNVSATLRYVSDGEDISRYVTQNVQNDGTVDLSIRHPDHFTPGLYQLTVHTNGDSLTQDFTWGVLAVNFDKTVYLPGNTAQLQFAKLDSNGNEVCGDLVEATLTAPDHTVTVLSTEDNTIQLTSGCGNHTVDAAPDYSASFPVKDAGRYDIVVRAKNNAGVHTISDHFTVEPNEAFSVERSGPTRIDPFTNPQGYPMKLRITPLRDWDGTIEEHVSSSFRVTDITSGGQVVNRGAETVIQWHAQLFKNQPITLEYKFQAPQISPQFYLLGQLQFGHDFSETRSWQIAADAQTNKICNWSGASSNAWGTAGNWGNGCNGTSDVPNNASCTSTTSGTCFWVNINNATNNPVLLGSSATTISGLNIGTSTTGVSMTINQTAGTLTIQNAGTSQTGFVIGAVQVGGSSTTGILNLNPAGAATCLSTTENAAVTITTSNGTITSSNSNCTWASTAAATTDTLTNNGTLSGLFSMSVQSTFTNSSTGVLSFTGGTFTNNTTTTVSCNNATRSNNKFFNFTAAGTTKNTTLAGSCLFAGAITINTGDKLITGTGTHESTATSGTLITNTGTFTATAGNTWIIDGTTAGGSVTINSAAISFDTLQIGTTTDSNTMTYNPGGNITASTAVTLGATSGTGIHTLDLLPAATNYNLTTGNLTIQTWGLLDGSGSTSTITVSGNYSNSGTFTAGTTRVTFTATSTGNTISGTLNGASAFYSVTFNGTGGGWTITDPIVVSKANGTDTFVISNGLVTLGNGNGDNLEVDGKMTIATTANQTGTFQTAPFLAQGNTITVDINANTSTPSCANCFVLVGATSGTGQGSFIINKNAVLRLNARRVATVSSAGVQSQVTGYINIQGSQDFTGTDTGTVSSPVDKSETKVCANTTFTASQHNGKNVRMTSGLAIGDIYDISATTVNDADCATATHDSVTINDTSNPSGTSTATMTVTGSGTVRKICSDNTTYITADEGEVGRYLHDLTGTTGYFLITASTNNDGTCTSSHDSFTVMANPTSSFAGLTTGDAFKIVDGIRSGDTFEILDYASVTNESGTSCSSAPTFGSGSSYIYATAQSETKIQYADIRCLGGTSANHEGIHVVSVNGANSNEGFTLDDSRIQYDYGMYLDGDTNNTGTKGVTNNRIINSNQNDIQSVTSARNELYAGNRISGTSSSVNTGIALNDGGSVVKNNIISQGNSNLLQIVNNNNTGADNVVIGNTIIESYNQIPVIAYTHNILANNLVINQLNSGISFSNTANTTVGNTVTDGLGTNSDAVSSSTGLVSINDQFDQVSLSGTNKTTYAYNTTINNTSPTISGTASLIDRKAGGVAGTTDIWGGYAIPSDDAETPQTESTEKYNYANNLWEKSTTDHNYDGTGTQDTNLDYDLSNAVLTRGPYVYRATVNSIGTDGKCTSTTKPTFEVYRNEVDVGTATCGTQFTDTAVDSDSNAVNVKFKIDGGTTIGYAIGDTYTFVTWDADNSTNTQKTLTLMRANDSYTVPSGATVQLKGQSAGTNVTQITRGASGGYGFTIAGAIDANAYSFNYLGTATNPVVGLNIQSTATVTSLDNGSFDNLANSSASADSFVNIDSGLIGSGTPTQTIANLAFNNTTSNADCNINAVGTDATGYWTISPSSGSFAGESFDCNDGAADPTPGQINWSSGSPTFTQAAYRFGNNQDSTSIDYTGPPAAPAANSAMTLTASGQKFRLRLLLAVGTADLSASGQSFKLQFGPKPSGGCSAASYSDVATGSGAIRYNDNPTPADGATLTSVTGDPTDGGNTIVNQTYEEANNFTNSVASIPSGQDGMWDFSLINSAGLGGTSYCFQVVKSDGTTLDTYSVYPEVAVAEELTFSLDSTSKNFGTITPGANPVDATSTVTTETNATSGYQVSLWATDLLKKGLVSISNWTGTNASPTTFGNGSTGFGYSTNDSNLTGGTADRFTNPSQKFAGFSTSGPGDPVADNTSPNFANENFTITYRLAVPANQANGTYTTNLIYIATPSY